MNEQRFICANCGFVFDKDISLGKLNIFCPHCGSNACNEYNFIKVDWIQ